MPKQNLKHLTLRQLLAVLGRSLNALDRDFARRVSAPLSGSKIRKCKKGHVLTDENVYSSGNSRRCKTCRDDWMRRNRERFRTRGILKGRLTK